MKQLDRVEAVESLELVANVLVHGREAGRVGGAFERFEVQLSQIDAVPIEAADQLLHPLRNGGEAIGIVQVHQLAPVQLRVLQDGGFLAPLGMRIPKLLADMRQFEPHVNQDRFAMAGFDQPTQVFVGLGVRLVVVPAGDVNRPDAGITPAVGEVIEIDARAVRAIEESPQALGVEGRLHAQVVQSLQQVREPFVSFFAGRDGDP